MCLPGVPRDDAHLWKTHVKVIRSPTYTDREAEGAARTRDVEKRQVDLEDRGDHDTHTHTHTSCTS